MQSVLLEKGALGGHSAKDTNDFLLLISSKTSSTDFLVVDQDRF